MHLRDLEDLYQLFTYFCYAAKEEHSLPAKVLCILYQM